VKICDEQIKEWISELVAGEGECYGYRKIRAILDTDHSLIVSVRKVYRLCKELDILRERAPRRNLDPVSIAINRTVTQPNQLWEMDIKYGFIQGEQRFFYVMSLIDVMDRGIVDFHVGLGCLASDAAAVLKGAMMRRQLYQMEKPPVIRTDNGPQFISLTFAAACSELEIHHERIPYKTPNKNAHIESFHASLQRECLGRQEFTTFSNAYEVVCRYIRHYNERRPHGSLRMLSPSKAYTRLCEGSLAIKAVTL